MDETKMEIEEKTAPTEESTDEEKPSLSRKRSGLRDRKVLAAQKERKLGRETSLWSMADHALRPRPVTTERFEPSSPSKAKKFGTKAAKDYKTMAIKALQAIGGRKGAISTQVVKFIESNYDLSGKRAYKSFITRALIRLVTDGEATKSGLRYKLKTQKGSGSTKKTLKRGSPKKPVKKATTTKKKKAESSSSESSMSESEDSDYGAKSKKKSPVKKSPVKKTTKAKEGVKKPAIKRAAATKAKKTATEKPVTRKAATKKATAPKPAATPAKAKPGLTRVPSTMIVKSDKPLEKNIIQTKLEILFCFDTTGSMYDWLATVQEKIGAICKQLLEEIQGIRIGIMAVADYDQSKPEPYVTKIKDFSTSTDEIASFVFGVEPTYGDDWEEAYELALQEARTKMSWTDGYSRALVMIGDAVPHGKDEYRKIDWEEELDLLIKHQVKVYGVQCSSTNERTTAFFKAISERSGGSHLELNQLESLAELIKGLCYREAAEVQFAAHREEIHERISRLERQGSAQFVPPPAATDVEPQQEELDISEPDILLIHNSLHDGTKANVDVDGETHEIAIGHAGCRFVTIGGLTFIQQNTDKDTKYARMALEGHSITWIVRGGRWGLIVDQDIVRK